jgi:hypothetical protein
MPQQFRTGLNVDDLEHTSPEEVANHLMYAWRFKGPLYRMFAVELMDDYAPTFSKIHERMIRVIGIGGNAMPQPSNVNVVLLSCQNIHSYMMLGWETGIRNEFYELWRVGMTKEQIMELVMFTQLYAGMRGLGHVYRATGDFLPAYGSPPVPLEFPDGWGPDPEAFRSGLDLSTREMTPTDRANLTAWYERTIGYVPASIEFGLKYHPEFVKVNRAKWEVAIRTLPKQIAPYLMLRHNVITQSVEGLREAALLGKAWGISRDFVIQAVFVSTYYFAGFEGLYAPSEALGEILDEWD